MPKGTVSIMVEKYHLDLFVIADRYGSISAGDKRAWVRADCPYCGAGTLVVLVQTREGTENPEATWARCTDCLRPVLVVDGRTIPPREPLSVPLGLAGVELEAWHEIRRCLGTGSYTAAVMLCRKLLLHLAVGHGLPAKDERDRAPSFVEAVDHLEQSGIFTARMRPWVERIKDIGNDANHEIQPITREPAMDVARFTEQLLRLAYEMDALMADPEQASVVDARESQDR
jgi:hypothetical protein